MRRARVRNACQPGWVSTPASVMGLVSMTSAAGRDIFLSIEETPATGTDRTYGTVTYGTVARVRAAQAGTAALGPRTKPGRDPVHHQRSARRPRPQDRAARQPRPRPLPALP